MQPPRSTGPGEPARPLPIARVTTGMTVVDAAGEEVGTVTAVEMPGTPSAPDLPDEQRGPLVEAGYLRAEASGLLSSAAFYAGGWQIGEVTTTQDEGVVTLVVRKEQLHRV